MLSREKVRPTISASQHGHSCQGYEPHRQPRSAELNSPARLFRSHPFASKRFHVLLNSLFKVLFNFPSWYLSAIGLVSVFSLRWSLPPTLGCILKQPDSWRAYSRARPAPYGPLTLQGCRVCHAQVDFRCRSAPDKRLPLTPQVPSAARRRGIRCWALPASLAVTRGILVSFFSSAYLYA